MHFMQRFSPDIDPQTIRLLDELAFVSRTIHHMGEQSVDDAGLSFAQYRVLLHLFFAEQMGDREQLNPSEISERQGVSRNTMSAFIRSLEEDGLVTRALDAEDRRRFNISLTESGRSVARDYVHDHLATIGRCFSALSADEQATLSHLLQKLGSHVVSERRLLHERRLADEQRLASERQPAVS
jgi:DNA-binding MarR family transcriptional regulator